MSDIWDRLADEPKPSELQHGLTPQSAMVWHETCRLTDILQAMEAPNHD